MIEADDTGEDELRRSLSDRPHDAAARVKLAMLAGRADALRLLREGAMFADGRPDRLQILAEGFEQLHALPDAIDLYQSALRFDHENGALCAALARLWAALGEKAKAEAMVARALSLGVDPVLGSLRDGPTAALARHLFDQYADGFDEHLLSNLKYAAPDHLERLLESHATKVERAIDLGCGTGLTGTHLRPRTAWLTGVDLSPAMLDKARDKACYDELVEAEAARYLRDCPAAGLIAAADVLGYIADLEPVFEGVARTLSAGGLFAASVERHEGEGYALTPARRYAHSQAYIATLAEKFGLTMEACEIVTLRTDNRVPVVGYALLLQRT